MMAARRTRHDPPKKAEPEPIAEPAPVAEPEPATIRAWAPDDDSPPAARPLDLDPREGRD